MPALPDVPGVIRVAHEGTIYGQPWATISHWRYVTSSGDLTSTELEVALAKFVNSWRDNIEGLCTPGTVDIQVRGIDLTSVTAAIATALDGESGTGADEPISPESCYLVSKTVARRYRGGHPRTYWPGPLRSFTVGHDGREIASGYLAAISSGFAAYYTDIPPAVTTDSATNISSFHEVMVSYRSGGVLRTVPAVDDVSGQHLDTILATQRRRMHRS